MVNVLFLCTHNSARSIMAESLLNALAAGRIRGYSAGSAPTRAPHPLALETLQGLGASIEGLRSKPWDEFAGSEAPPMDLVITVCDNAAGEVCPVWPGRPVTAHWSIEDPSSSTGGIEEQRRGFAAAAAKLRQRIEQLAALPLDKLDRAAKQAAVRAIVAE